MSPMRLARQARTLMVLGARRAQLPAIQTALAMGLRVVAVDPDPAAPGLALATLAGVYDLADLGAILKLARAEEIDGIMTLAADYPMPTLAAVCAEMCLPGPRPQVVDAATNKRLMRLALRAAGVPCPLSHHASNLEEARKAVAKLATDTILKPAASQGGRGITRVAAGSAPEVVDWAYLRALKETRADGVMVEQFIEGPEFSVESLTHGGQTHVIAVTDKLTSGAPYYVELGHSQPSRWTDAQVESLRRAARSAISALGIDQAAGHTELRLTAQGPVIMEVAARLGGGFINSHLVPLSTGIDLVGACIQVALGDPPDLTPKRPSGAAAIRFLSATPGLVSSIERLGELSEQEGLVEADVYVRPGDLVPELVDAGGRVGHVICRGRDPDHALALAERAMDRIHVLTRAREAR